MSETAQIIRDIFLSIYLAGGILLTLVLIVIAFLLYKAVKGLLGSVQRVTENVGEFSDLAVENLVTPMKEGVSFSSALGNAFGFMTGFVSGMKGGRKDKKEATGARDRRREQEREQRERKRRKR